MILIYFIIAILLALIIGFRIAKLIKVVNESYAMITWEVSRVLHSDLVNGRWNVGVLSLKKPFVVEAIYKYAELFGLEL